MLKQSQIWTIRKRNSKIRARAFRRCLTESALTPLNSYADCMDWHGGESDPEKVWPRLRVVE